MNTVRVLWSLFGLLAIAYGQINNDCVTPNGEQAKCISFYKCQVMVNALSNRTSEVVKFLRDSRCGYVEDPLVCCGSVATYRQVATPAPPPVVTQKPSGPFAHRNLNLVPAVGKCGIQLAQDRIFGGEETGIDEFPWMALLEYEMNGKSVGHSCGGVIINERYVLTAAHCVVGKITRDVGNIFRVRLGEYDQRTTTDCIIKEGKPDCAAPHQDILVEEALGHAEYIETGSRYNDIGLIRLASNIKYNDFVKPICLPISVSRTQPGQNLTIAGWGYTEKNIYSPVKLKVNLPVVAEQQCSTVFKRFRVQVSDSQLCAGGEKNRDSCQGDSGGPLMRTFPKRSEFFVEGIVSFGAACGSDGVPGIYTRVSEYLDWILDNMKPF